MRCWAAYTVNNSDQCDKRAISQGCYRIPFSPWYTHPNCLTGMTFVDHTSINFPLNIRAEGTGTDIVLLHGWGMNSGAFHEFIPYLSDSFTVTTIDLPGFGENANYVPEPYTLASLTASILPYIPKGAFLAGWSLGGLVAQHIACDANTPIGGLITIASTPKFDASRGWPGIEPDILTMFESQLERDYQKTLDRFLMIQAMGSETARKDIKTIKKQITQYPNPSALALRDGLGLLSEVDLRHHIGRIQVPTLKVYGRLDSLVPTSAIDQIHELQPQADSVVLPHASHAPFISHPQQCADVIRQFVFSVC